MKQLMSPLGRQRKCPRMAEPREGPTWAGGAGASAVIGLWAKVPGRWTPSAGCVANQGRVNAGLSGTGVVLIHSSVALAACLAQLSSL